MSSLISPMSPNEELWTLTEQLVDETISPAGRLQLEARLLADRASQDFYLTCIDLHARLRWLARGKDQTDTDALDVPDATAIHLPPLEADDPFEILLKSARQSQPSTILRQVRGGDKPLAARLMAPLVILGTAGQQHAMVVLTSALVICAAVGAWMFGPWTQNHAGLSARQTFAYLTADKGCQWSDAKRAVGDQLTGGALRLLSGVARLEFADGAQLVIEGPSEIELLSAGSVYLGRGKLLALVPRQAIGFTVETPSAKIIDRGTEFVVDVAGNQQTKLAVTKGLVELQTTGAQQRVSAGKALNISRDSAGESTIEPGSFDAAWIDHAARLNESLPKTFGAAIAFQVTPDGVTGNQGNYHNELGLDFDIKQPIRVTNLGVFDSLGDGIQGESPLEAQLWSRDSHGTADPADDTGIEMLAVLSFAAHDPGVLKGGHRFKRLAQGIELAPGSYTIIARGFSKQNPNVNFILATKATMHVETSADAITPALASRCQKPGAADPFPASVTPITLGYAAGSFMYAPANDQSQD